MTKYINSDVDTIMAVETERKFLVNDLEAALTAASKSRNIEQYYIHATPECAIRLRIEEGVDGTVLAIKTGGSGISVHEHEFQLPAEEYAARASERIGVILSKSRHDVIFQGRKWEVDVFHGPFEGLVVAEIEAEDAAAINELPHWIGEDVTHDRGYKNAVLCLTGKIPGEERQGSLKL